MTKRSNNEGLRMERGTAGFASEPVPSRSPRHYESLPRAGRQMLSLCAVVVGAALLSGAGSPDHFEAAFADGDRIVLLRQNGASVVLQRPEIQSCDAASISNDGKRLAFTALDPSTGYAVLFIADAPAFVPVRAGSQIGWHRDPVWSPDGTKLVFALHPNSHLWDRFKNRDPAQLFEQDLATGDLRRISEPGICNHFPSFLPDGSGLVLTETDCRTHWNIARVDLKTGRKRLLTSGFVRDHQPVVSPDGSRLAYVRVDGERSVLRLARLDGSGMREIAVLRHAIVPQLRWSRDGRKIHWFADHRVRSLDVEAALANPSAIEVDVQPASSKASCHGG